MTERIALVAAVSLVVMAACSFWITITLIEIRNILDK